MAKYRTLKKVFINNHITEEGAIVDIDPAKHGDPSGSASYALVVPDKKGKTKDEDDVSSLA